MVLKYDVNIDNDAIVKNIDRITNQVFKMLPCREEGGEWKSLLQNLIIELTGMDELFLDQISLFSLLCKMEALMTLTEEDDFPAFRKCIFECLGLLSTIKKNVIR